MRRLSFSFVPTCTIWRIHSVWKSTKMAYQKLKSYSLARFQNSPLGVSRCSFFSRAYLTLMKPVKMRIFSFKIPASLMCLVIFRHCCIQFFFCWEKEEWMKSWKSIGLLDTFLSAQWIAWYFRCFVCVFGIFGVSAICQILQLWHLFQLPKRQSCTQKPSDENDGNFSIFLFYISSRV